MPAHTLQQVGDLLADRSHHIEFNGHLTNHVKHAVIALAGIGAPEQTIREYYRSYTALTPYGFPLEQRRGVDTVIDADNWREFLGRRSHFDAYCAFFDAEIDARGITGAVATYAPELLHGWIGAFTHATIHLGWAVWSEHRAMTAEALAYLAFSYVHVATAPDIDKGPAAADPVHGLASVSQRWENDVTFRSAVETVIADTNSVTELHPELNRSGLQARVAAVAAASIPQLVDTPRWLGEISAEQRREGVRRAVTLHYLADPGDFVVLHLITALFALEVLADTLGPNAATEVYRLFWAGARVISAAERKIPSTAKLGALEDLYPDGCGDRDEHTIAEFDTAARRAWLEDEEHNPKLVFVLRSWWNDSDWRGYRHAANQFTRTPELPASFADPPTE